MHYILKINIIEMGYMSLQQWIGKKMINQISICTEFVYLFVWVFNIYNLIQYQEKQCINNNMKSLTLKQAEKWLQKLKQADPNAYRDIGKSLRRFDQTSDELQCFLKLNQTLYSLPNLAQQINVYMQQGNKFIINTGIQEMLKQFLETVRQTKKELMKQIIDYVNKVISQESKIAQMSDQESIKVFKTGIIEIVKSYPQLVTEAQKITHLTQEQSTKKLDLKHLKNKVIKYDQQPEQKYLQQQQQIIEQQDQASKNVVGAKKTKKTNQNQYQYQNDYLMEPEKPRERQRSRQKSRERFRDREREKQRARDQQPKQKIYQIPSFLTTSQQKSYLKQLEKKVGSFAYRQIIKILELYQHNIISRPELLEFIEPILGEQIGGFKDITESRQIDRRKNSLFKPLCDTDFHILPRETHSYIEMPANYPHFAINRTKQLQPLLNNNWVSVPRGSEVIFNVRIKNIHEQSLNKCEDQRYEFDLVIRRFRKIIEIFNRVALLLQEKLIVEKEIQRMKINQMEIQIQNQLNLQNNKQIQIAILLKTAFSLGVLQILYKNATKQQKQALENSIHTNPGPTLKILLQRVKKALDQLQQYKNLYATKMWNEIANKNFYKSLDFKNHEFKNFEKLRMKPQSFIDQLNINLQYLESRGTKRINENPFEGKKQFFSVLNSFESYSRKQKCYDRHLPNPKIFDVAEYKFPNLLPAMIISFEDKSAMDLMYNYIGYYLEYSVINQSQRNRCKLAYKQIMINFFKMNEFKNRSLGSAFQEQKFFSNLLNNKQALYEENTQNWIQTHIEYVAVKNPHQINDKIPYLNLTQQADPQYKFQPQKNERNLVFYGSQNFYVFLRYIYILYQRIIRMKQISKNQRTLQLFQILYYSCIKTKQNIRFEDSMSILFGDFAYLFTTFYKIVEGIVKTLGTVALSPIQNYSFTLLSMKNQQVYLLLLNRYMLNLQVNTNRLIRATYEFDTKLVYINSFNPYYRFNDENLKEYNKKRLEISKTVQTYNTEGAKLDKQRQRKNSKDKGTKKFVNRQQYYFESNSNKLINIPSFEDIIMSSREKSRNYLKLQLKKIKNIKVKLY